MDHLTEGFKVPVFQGSGGFKRQIHRTGPLLARGVLCFGTAEEEPFRAVPPGELQTEKEDRGAAHQRNNGGKQIW